MTYKTEKATFLGGAGEMLAARLDIPTGDRKSTRLNSSHITISYAVFCLKKKNIKKKKQQNSRHTSATCIQIGHRLKY